MLAAVADHPHARAVLGAALAPGATPSHAYLFHGPPGAGKRAAARELAGVLLSRGAPDPEGVIARVGRDAHPDLTWVRPSGAHELLVSDVDVPVVGAATRTPFEAAYRVFVIERADTLGEEAANRMLKTLEEPARFVHLVLLTDRLGEVLPTILSRCQLVRFEAPAPQDIARRLGRHGVAEEPAAACAALALGDPERALALALGEGPALRAAAERLARAPLGDGARRPWSDLLALRRRRGDAAAEALSRHLERDLELAAASERRRLETAWAERMRRVRRRVETEALDLALQLVSLWYRDLACLAWQAPDLVCHRDRREVLAGDAGRDPRRLRAAVELVEDTRRRLQLNVSEELALEALSHRLAALLG